MKKYIILLVLLSFSINAHAIGVDDAPESIFGDGSDGALSTVGNVTYGSANQMAVHKQYTDFTLNAGHVVTVDTACRGLYIHATGTITLNTGHVTMTGLGYCNSNEGAGYLITKTSSNFTFATSATTTKYFKEIRGAGGGAGGAGGASAGCLFGGCVVGAGGAGGEGNIYGGGLGGGGGSGTWLDDTGGDTCDAPGQDGMDAYQCAGANSAATIKTVACGVGTAVNAPGVGGVSGLRAGNIFFIGRDIVLNGATFNSFGTVGGSGTAMTQVDCAGTAEDSAGGGGAGGGGGGAVTFVYNTFTESSAGTYNLQGALGGVGGQGGTNEGSGCGGADGSTGSTGSTGRIYKYDIPNETFTATAP